MKHFSKIIKSVGCLAFSGLMVTMGASTLSTTPSVSAMAASKLLVAEPSSAELNTTSGMATNISKYINDNQVSLSKIDRELLRASLEEMNKPAEEETGEKKKKNRELIATVDVLNLKMREEPSIEADVVTVLPQGQVLEVTDQSVEGWVGVKSISGEGYVSKEFVELEDLKKLQRAQKKAEEEQKKAEEEARRAEEERLQALEEAKKAEEELKRAEEAKKKSDAETNSSEKDKKQSEEDAKQAEVAKRKADEAKKKAEEAEKKAEEEQKKAEEAKKKAETEKKKAEDTEKKKKRSTGDGAAVVDYALQFVGNPYRFGGTSLTNGADCSGFVMKVYEEFGVDLPHSSYELRSKGKSVSKDEMQPGDIVCYSGHVAICIGDNMIVHASNEKTGIKVSTDANYRNIVSVRRIFE